MTQNVHGFPEPVPEASQLAVLSFLAGVDGYLRKNGEVAGLRITMHRLMNRQGIGYLQQLCDYILDGRVSTEKRVGRTFPSTAGIMGAAFHSGKIVRTKFYQAQENLLSDLSSDMRSTEDIKSIDQVGKSYLAVPFIGSRNQPILILYAECHTFNFFADNERIENIVSMCRGFCSVFDALDLQPLSDLHNYELFFGPPRREDPTVYPIVQETIDLPTAPRFEHVEAFNYEASA